MKIALLDKEQKVGEQTAALEREASVKDAEQKMRIAVADANAKKYRAAEEIEQYKVNHDPLRLWSRRLVEEGILTEPEIEEIDFQAKEETNEAVKFAEESPILPESEIMSDVYWEVDHQTDAAKQGRYFFNS